MMGMSDNVQIVRHLYMAFGQGDIAGIFDLLAEDVDWHFVGRPQDVPYAGHRLGHEAMFRFFNLMTELCEVHEFGPREIICSGDHVIVLGHERIRVRHADRFFETDWLHLFTVREGKIVQLREFHDTATLAAAFHNS
jgi:hypothetical protein